MIQRYGDALGDGEDGPAFWVALALTQSKVGRLRDDVRDRALGAISAGPDDRWDEPELHQRRAEALEKARATLVGPQPARTRLRPPFRHVTPPSNRATSSAGFRVIAHVPGRAGDHAVQACHYSHWGGLALRFSPSARRSP